ncbi:MAG: hypothetical protein ACI814_002145 [Mariniblastus sp.]|jgi:hypothetical protein
MEAATETYNGASKLKSVVSLGFFVDLDRDPISAKRYEFAFQRLEWSFEFFAPTG